MKKIFLIVFITFLLVGCSVTNPYSDTYVNTSSPNISVNDIKPLTENDIKLINSKNVKDDLINAFENGYEMIGYSSFNTTDVSEKYIKSQALNVNATMVIYSKQFTSQDSELEPVFFDDFCSRRYYNSMDCGGPDWQYVQKSKYDYLATFWIKANLTGLGILVQDISIEKRKELETNYGAEVKAVRKDSEAYKEIALGDVITKINGSDIKDKDEYTKEVEKNKGKKVKLELLRKGKVIIKELVVK